MVSKKVPEIDILRVIAILIVMILIHIPHDYAYNIYIEIDAFTGFLINTLGIHVAMGSYVFLSGFGLYLQKSNRNINTYEKLIIFLKKRFLRIFPLYWLALFLFIIMFDYVDYNILYLLAHFLGMQIIFAPLFDFPIFTLWFIGIIVIYYFIFIILSSLGSIRKIILGSIAILFFFLSLNFIFGIVEYRFFTYYLIFIVGIVAADIYGSPQFDLIKESLTNKHSLIPTISIIFCVVLSGLLYITLTQFSYTTFTSIYRTTQLRIIFDQQRDFIELAIAFILVNLIILTFITFILSLFYLLIKVTCLIFNEKRVRNILSLLAYSTYSVYLFHRPFFAAFTHIMVKVLNIDVFARNLFLPYLIVTIPFILIIGFFIQNTVDKKILPILDQWISRRIYKEK